VEQSNQAIPNAFFGNVIDLCFTIAVRLECTLDGDFMRVGSQTRREVAVQVEEEHAWKDLVTGEVFGAKIKR
jgi:hypothetical protein